MLTSGSAGLFPGGSGGQSWTWKRLAGAGPAGSRGAEEDEWQAGSGSNQRPGIVLESGSSYNDGLTQQKKEQKKEPALYWSILFLM